MGNGVRVGIRVRVRVGVRIRRNGREVQKKEKNTKKIQQKEKLFLFDSNYIFNKLKK